MLTIAWRAFKSSLPRGIPIHGVPLLLLPLPDFGVFRLGVHKDRDVEVSAFAVRCCPSVNFHAMEGLNAHM